MFQQCLLLKSPTLDSEVYHRLKQLLAHSKNYSYQYLLIKFRYLKPRLPTASVLKKFITRCHII